MQYLLDIDYFSHNKIIDSGLLRDNPQIKDTKNLPNFDYKLNIAGETDETKKKIESILKDKSDWVASITSINGMLNGSTGPYGLDIDEDTMKFEFLNSK